MMHRIRLLHISDLHARGHREGEAWRRRRVLGDSFWQNLDELKADGAFDLVCLTGDLGDWGQPDEYATVAAFLSELLERLGLAKDRLCLVPGNHDIARPVASMVEILREWMRGMTEPWHEPGQYTPAKQCLPSITIFGKNAICIACLEPARYETAIVESRPTS